MNITILYGIFFSLVICLLLTILKPWELLKHREEQYTFTIHEPPKKPENIDNWIGLEQEMTVLDNQLQSDETLLDQLDQVDNEETPCPSCNVSNDPPQEPTTMIED